MTIESGEQAIEEMKRCRANSLFVNAVELPVNSIGIRFENARRIAIATRAGDGSLPRSIGEESCLYTEKWEGVY